VTTTPRPDAGGLAGGLDGRLVVLCGRSFSGKSTVAGWLREGLGGEIVSFDEINEQRGLWGGGGIAVAEWIHTGEIATQRVRAALELGETVIVDDISSPRFLRDRWRSLADELDVSMVLVFVDTTLSTIRARQGANRAGRTRGDVTDAVMDQHLEGFEPPEPDEPAVVVSEISTEKQVVSEVDVQSRRPR
jgi:predicted kinase